MEMRSLQIGMGWFPELPGGLDRMFFDLRRFLPMAGVGFRGLVVGSDRVAQSTNGEVQAFASMGTNPMMKLLLAKRAIKENIKRYRPDILASHFSYFTAAGLAHIDVPMIVHFHGPWAAESIAESRSASMWRKPEYYAKYFIEKAVYRRGEQFITLSKAFAEILSRQYRVPQEMITVVPGGIDVRNYRLAAENKTEDARTTFNVETSRPIVLAVRRLRKRMGLENLISSMTQIRRDVPEARLLIAGAGPLAETLTRQILDLDLTNHVELLGFVPDDMLPSLYSLAALSIVPSVSLEGFGLTTIESMAVGAPVLVTPVGGLPEVVGGLSNSLILESPEPRAIADGVVSALRGERNLPSRERCSEFVLKEYDWSSVAARLSKVYADAISKAR